MLTRARRAAAALAALVLALAPASTANADIVRERQLPLLDALDMPAAWKLTRGKGVTVAVVDSGVNARHADLRGSVIAGPNLLARIDRAGPPTRGHGTAMASLIAGHGHGPGAGDGIVGLAPQARILAIRVIAEPEDPSWRAYRADENSESTVAEGVRYAADHGADVINLSLGKDSEIAEERAAIGYAIGKGVVIVAAVGNDGEKRRRFDDNGFAPYTYPASYPGVIAVAATDPGHRRATFSNRNYSVLLSAPGVEIPAAAPNGDYYLSSGTSDATALVSGVAALVRARHPKMPPALVAQALLASTRYGPTGIYDPAVGFGEVNAVRALNAADRLLQTPSGGLHAGQRVGPRDPGPVKVVDHPAWAKPAALAIIGSSVAGAGTAIMIAVILFRRTRPGAVPAAPPMPYQPPIPPPITRPPPGPAAAPANPFAPPRPAMRPPEPPGD